MLATVAMAIDPHEAGAPEPKRRASAWALMGAVMALVFVSEGVVMLIISRFEPVSVWLMLYDSVMLTILLIPGLYAVVLKPLLRTISERERAEEEREAVICELREALANVKALSGMLPICASCKKVRDDKGYWTQVEAYISKHSEAEFSHSICPECVKRLYPDFIDDDQAERPPGK